MLRKYNSFTHQFPNQLSFPSVRREVKITLETKIQGSPKLGKREWIEEEEKEIVSNEPVKRMKLEEIE